MRNILTILLTILTLSCTSQEPDIECYSQDYLDSVLLLNVQNCNEQLMNSQVIIDSLDIRISFLENLLESKETTVIADTFNFEIADDKMKIEVTKINHSADISVLHMADTIGYLKIKIE